MRTRPHYSAAVAFAALLVGCSGQGGDGATVTVPGLEPRPTPAPTTTVTPATVTTEVVVTTEPETAGAPTTTWAPPPEGMTSAVGVFEDVFYVAGVPVVLGDDLVAIDESLDITQWDLLTTSRWRAGGRDYDVTVFDGLGDMDRYLDDTWSAVLPHYGMDGAPTVVTGRLIGNNRHCNVRIAEQDGRQLGGVFAHHRNFEHLSFALLTEAAVGVDLRDLLVGLAEQLCPIGE